MTCSMLLGSARTLPSAARRKRYEIDVGAEDALKHVVHVGEQVVQLEHPRREHLLPAEHEQLVGQAARPPSRLLDLLDLRAHRLALLEVRHEQLAVAEDDGEHVVEIVRHAACEPPHGVHLLRLTELLFQPKALGHVPSHRHSTGAVAEREGVLGDLDLDEIAVLLPQPPRSELWGDAGVTLGFEKGRDILRRPELLDRHVEELGAGVAEVADRGLVDVQEPERLGVIHPLRERAVVEHQPVPRLARAQGLFGPMTLGDVGRDAEHPFVPTLRVVQRGSSRSRGRPRFHRAYGSAARTGPPGRLFALRGRSAIRGRSSAKKNSVVGRATASPMSRPRMSAMRAFMNVVPPVGADRPCRPSRTRPCAAIVAQRRDARARPPCAP